MLCKTRPAERRDAVRLKSDTTGIAAARQRTLHAIGRERHLADADASRVEDRIADRGGDDRDRRLTAAHRFAPVRVDQHALDRRRLDAEWQAVIRAPVDRGDRVVVPRHLLTERAAQALQRAALELIA